ncbi:2992_t:CDS:2 [Cetraspora pellucida]|uniref:2992_t:CDS:1 n=1 Tax=Cetraspora pellucida TaxID=1433469 RepID=A0ACA9LWS1_9GLOM|nr:2992_t:CDS:2 [Cetraspora pellucida]
MSSLRDFKQWRIIEFRKPMSIFQFLDDKLKYRIRQLNGKMTIYSNVQDYSFKMHDYSAVDPQVFFTTISNVEDDKICTCMFHLPPPPDIFDYFRADRDMPVKKMRFARMIKSKRQNIENAYNKLSDFISLYREEHDQFETAFIGKKHGRFFIMQPDGRVSRDNHFFVAVFNPEFKDQAASVVENESQITCSSE